MRYINGAQAMRDIIGAAGGQIARDELLQLWMVRTARTFPQGMKTLYSLSGDGEISLVWRGGPVRATAFMKGGGLPRV